MTDKRNGPIEVSFGVWRYRTVTGPFDAMICLTDLWPDRRGAHFVRARSACRGAIAGRVGAEQARAEFLAAAEEARILTH
jgi:hypothetical protein